MDKKIIIKYFKTICSDKYDGITKLITKSTCDSDSIFETLMQNDDGIAFREVQVYRGMYKLKPGLSIKGGTPMFEM